jgi:hypothetical protein
VGNEFPHPIRVSSRLADVLRSRRSNKREPSGSIIVILPPCLKRN